MGRWIEGTVMAVSDEEVLFKHTDGRVERILKKKIVEVRERLTRDNLIGKRVMAYITLPGVSSHMGTFYEGSCIER